MTLKLPSVFIGSSVEGLGIAHALQIALEFDAEPTVWNQGIFKPTRHTLRDLMGAMESSDFAVFIFTPDDITTLRGGTYSVARDNVIFEMGMFIGYLGLERCFFIHPRNISDFHLPSDLLGMTPLTYNPFRQDKNLLAALGPASYHIRQAINACSPLTNKSAQDSGQVTTSEISHQRFLRYKNLWAGDLFTKDRLLLNQGISLWVGEDESGQDTQALQRVVAFLETVADAVIDGHINEVETKEVFSSAMLSVWTHAKHYFFQPGGEGGEKWQTSLAVVCEKWLSP